MQGVNIKLHGPSLIFQSVKSISLYKPTLFRSIFISPDEDLLFEVETSSLQVLILMIRVISMYLIYTQVVKINLFNIHLK